MKTQNTKLAFSKSSLIELNTIAMSQVNGGSLSIIVDKIKEQITNITQY